MTKIIEQFKMKKLAKKIAGVTLGAIALGAMSMSPVYATETPGPGMINGGTLNTSTNEYIGGAPNYAVVIDGSSTGTPLADGMKIYGNTTGTSGSVTAANFDSSSNPGVTGLQIWGGYSTVDGVKGIDNKVIWSDTAKVKKITTITGFEASANGASAKRTDVTVNGATVADSGKVYGDRITAAKDDATAMGTNLTLTNTKFGSYGEIYGANVTSTSANATATGTKVTLNDNTQIGDGAKIYGANVTATGTATATGTNLTLDKTEIEYSPHQSYGAYVKSTGGDATATDTTLTMTDSDVSTQDFAGAHVEGETSATATNTKVNLTGGIVQQNFYGVEVGVNDKGVAEATSTTLTINGATLKYKSRGAYVKGKKSGKAIKTEVTITGGEINDSFNAAEVQANEADSIGHAEDTKLKIDGAKLKISVEPDSGNGITGAHVTSNAGGEILSTTGTTVTLLNLTNDDTAGNLIGVQISGDTGHTEQAASATAYKTEVEMNGGKVKDVFGTKFYHVKSAEAKATTVTLNNTEVVSTVIGVNVTEGGDPTPIAENTKAEDTTVTVTGTKVKDAIIGVNVAEGSSVTDPKDAKTISANNTKLTINGTNVTGDVTGVWAKATDTITATNTQVIFEGEASKVTGTVYGANVNSGSGKASATGTTVTLSGATVDYDGEVYAAHVTATGTATATGTNLTLDNTKIKYSPHQSYGAYVKSTGGDATATDTTLTMTDSDVSTQDFAGAHVEGETSATATNTKVNLTGGIVQQNFYGVEVGVNDKGVAEATSTTLTINGATLKYKSRGAYVKGKKRGTAIKTEVTITGGEINDSFNAAEVQANEADSIGHAEDTKLKIDGAKLKISVEPDSGNGITGAHVTSNAGGEILSTTGTTVTLLNLTNDDTAGNLIGVQISGDTGHTEQAASATAYKTEVEMNGGKVKDVFGTKFYHVKSAEAKATTMTLNNTEVVGTVIGVNVTENKDDSTPIAENATINDTTVTVTGAKVIGAIKGVNVAAVTSSNTEAKTVTANNTKLTINSTNVGGDVAGVWAKSTNSITATNTQLIFEGAPSTVTGTVYGANINSGSGDATATGTTVTLNDNTKIGESREIYGANVKSDSGKATATGTKVTLTGTKVDGDPKWKGFSVYGAYVESGSGKATATETNTTLTNTDIGFQGNVYGANVKSTGDDATATGTTLTLTGTTTEGNNNIWGAKVEGKTSATATNTKVNITDSSVKADKFHGVEVGNQSTDKAAATGTTLTINGAILNSEVLGALVKGKKDVKASDTKITITGGEIHNLLNAAEVKANEAGSTGQANNTTLIIDGTEIASNSARVQGAEVSSNAGGEILSAKNTTVQLLNISGSKTVEYLTGVKVSGDTGHEVQAASTKADKTEVEMNGGKVKDVVGAKFYHTKLAEAKDTTVTLNKVEEAETVIGVNITQNEGTTTPIAETATANDTTVTVTSTTVTGAIRGVNVATLSSGVEAKTVTADNTKLTINGTNVGGDVTGVWAKATDTITATNTQVIFEGAASTVKGTVYGVNITQNEGSPTAIAKTATATGTTVELNDTNIDVQRNVYGANVKSDSGKATATGTTLTLNNITTKGNNKIWGAKVEGKTSATADTTNVEMTGGSVNGDLYGVDVKATDTGVAEATGTTLIINDATLGKAWGAKVEGIKSGEASNNEVEMTGGELKESLNAAEVHVNGVSSIGQANSTTLIISGTKIASNNVHIQGAEVSANAGGEIMSATGTTVKLLKLTNDDKMGDLIGVKIHSDTGHFGTASATVDTTEVEMNGGKVKDVVGAKIDHVEKVETNNKTSVTLNNVTAESVTGVHVTDTSIDHPYSTKKVTANNTKLTIKGTTVTGDVTGVWAKATEEITATNTQVIFEGAASKVTGTVYGVQVSGYTGTKQPLASATADTTEVEMNGGKVQNVVGAMFYHTKLAEAKVTTVTLNKVEEAGTVYGVNITQNEGSPTAIAETATATKTTVKLNDTTVTNNGKVYGAYVTSGSGDATATETNTTLTNTDIGIQGKVYGAYVTSTSGNATATGTTLTLTDTTTEGKNNIWGAKVKSETSATATGTTLNITRGSVDANFYGVDVEVTDSATGVAEATDTKLIINGANVGGDITGVRANATEKIIATNTQVIFEGAASKVTGTVYGVNLSEATSTTSSETALTLKNTGNTAGNIAGFDTINFVLPSNIQDDKAILTLTTSEDTDLTSTDLTIDATRANIKVKDKVFLIDKRGNGALKLKKGTEGAKVATFVENATTVKTATYAIVDTNDLVLKISEDGEKPQDVVDNEKSLTETIAASVALLNSGADFATEQALGQAKAAAREGVKEGTREMMPFAAFGGSSMKYKSGSHIDAKGWNAAFGFAKEQGELTYGIAVEHGQANFDSYVNAAHGEGKNKYTGGVIFAELKKKSGVHFDASFRAGRAENDYNANLSVLGISTPTSYDISANYLGFSLGGGKEMKVSETRTIDLYGRYYFNHLNGANAKTNSGIDIDFKDSDSSRLRLGTRYTQKVDEYNNLYAGLAWQYEFAGKAKAIVNGTDAPSPSLKGHSAMLELGIKSKAGKNLDIDLGLNGWVGKQRGIGGNIGFKWSF